MILEGVLSNSQQILDAFISTGWNLYCIDPKVNDRIDIISRGPAKELIFNNEKYPLFYVAFPAIKDPTNALDVQLEYDKISEHEGIDVPFINHRGGFVQRVPVSCFAFTEKGMEVIYNGSRGPSRAVLVRPNSVVQFITNELLPLRKVD
jgi:hypothetical protein